MKDASGDKQKLKYLSAYTIYEHLKQFTAGMSVTKGQFEIIVPDCTLKDMEWNHMDQMHRPSIHNTYQKGIRLITGKDFALSLTQWGKWPFFITVTDAYVAEGLFYQSFTLAGIIFVHSVISMESLGESVRLKHEWYIASHKIFKLLHHILSKQLYKLNIRLQAEDEPLRQGRYHLRKLGYHFKTNQPDYYNSNILGQNTIYPDISADAFFSVAEISAEKPQQYKINNLEFIVKKYDTDSYRIWPAACPHEGGPLLKGNFCEAQVTCPWHGLHFRAAEVSKTSPLAVKYGFEYLLKDQCIYVKKLLPSAEESHEMLETHCANL